jgi:glucose/arabinose dehydrogenase
MRRLMFILMLFGLISGSVQAQSGTLQLDDLVMPPGFSISVFAEGIENARSLARGDEGTIFVGSRSGNFVTALVDHDSDFRADERFTIGGDLYAPNGVAFKDGSLYVAEVHRIIRYDDIESHLANPPEPVVVYDDLPTDDHHGWKYLRIGPDDKLYVPQGVPCNVCETESPYGTIMRMNLDGSDVEIIARGVRNSVGFDWDPVTGDLWFTDNGRDWISDDLPPDELNHISGPDQHFGFPYCHGGFLEDIDFGSEGVCEQYQAPAQNLGPHVAALGMRFYNGEMFPEAYRNQIIIAEHGSWNRSTRIGYQLALVRLEDGAAVAYEPFVSGWMNEATQEFTGRPVDLLIMPDGSLLVSDDFVGAIYRVVYTAE